MKILYIILFLILAPSMSFALTIEAEVEKFTEVISEDYGNYVTRDIIFMKSKDFIVSMPRFSFVGGVIEYVCPIGATCKIKFESGESCTCNLTQLEGEDAELPHYHEIDISSIKRVK